MIEEGSATPEVSEAEMVSAVRNLDAKTQLPARMGFPIKPG